MPGKRLGGVVGAAIASYCACSSSASWSDHVAYADGFLLFPPFSSSSSATTHDDRQPSDADDAYKKQKNEETGKVGGKSSGFDPESLERGAKALREINSSPHSKQVFDIMRRQEDTRLLELDVERTHFQANQSLADIIEEP